MDVIDFDNLDNWAPRVTEAIEEIAPRSLLPELEALEPEFIEDARDFVVTCIGRNDLLAHLTERFKNRFVRLYHGTRLTENEITCIRNEGLKPLMLSDRASALKLIFRQHPRWGEVKANFEETLSRFGPGNAAGRREDGCVHACFSQSALLSGCSHYLAYGAEVDGHIASALFNDEMAKILLRQARTAKLVSFIVPFSDAALAANPFGFPSDDLPSLIDILLGAWAYRQAHPAFTVISQRNCRAASFPRAINANEIDAIIHVDDADIDFNRA